MRLMSSSETSVVHRIGDRGHQVQPGLHGAVDSTAVPPSIGPPETNTVGMFSRSAAISMPGVILSQLEIHTSAFAQCALTMYSPSRRSARGTAASRACRRGPSRCRRRRRWC